MSASRLASQILDAVILDFHGTLVDTHEPIAWVAAAQRQLAEQGLPASDLDAVREQELAQHLHDVWAHAIKVDPGSTRDLASDRHRQVFTEAVRLFGDLDTDLVDAMYTVMPDQWVPFDDAVPVLSALKAQGVRTVLLSNIGIDIRPHLRATGLADLLDDVVLSYEAGLVKPDPGIFRLALDRLGRRASQTLMVGDSARDDVGGVSLGIRTLILPRETGRIRGLDAVLRLVGLPYSPRSASGQHGQPR